MPEERKHIWVKVKYIPSKSTEIRIFFLMDKSIRTECMADYGEPLLSVLGYCSVKRQRESHCSTGNV